MTRCTLTLTSFSVMLVCVTAGWHKGASPVFALVFLPCIPVFAACWWSKVTEARP